MTTRTLRTTAELEAALDHLRAAPTDTGEVTLVVRRPERLEREVLDEGELDPEAGLVGDNWRSRATSRAVEDGRHYEAMLTLMSARMVALLADADDERALAGDQLYVDLDLSVDNLPVAPGSRWARPRWWRSPPSRTAAARSSWPGSAPTPWRSSTATRAPGCGCAASTPACSRVA